MSVILPYIAVGPAAVAIRRPELKTTQHPTIMTAKLMTITPAIAAKLLENNPKNRQLNTVHVARLAKEIKEGRWKVNGDMIRLTGFNGKGSIIDGQHRLSAVIKSGISIQSWVMGGLPEDVFNTIDSGRLRSKGDTLFCDGEKSAKKIAAALVIIDQYKNKRFGFGQQYSNTQVQELLRLYPEVRYCLTTQRTAVLPPSIFHACIYLFSMKDQELAQNFSTAIVTGIGLKSKDPFYVLRELLLKNRVGAGRFTKSNILALCILAWNFARENKKISVLRLPFVDNKLAEFPIIK